MEDYYEYLDSNGVTTLYKLIKDDTVALIDSYSVTLNGITTNLDNHVNNTDIHTPITDIEGMIGTAIDNLNYATPDYVDTKVSNLVNSAPETLDTLKELSDALGNDPNFATTVANQIGSKASKDDVYTKLETNTLLEGKANSVHSHVVSDITDMPTIPTKVSDLTNDSGYITSVNWDDITSKPVLSQVAISGSYSDLSNTPTIPTKVSQLENDTGFVNALTDVVDTKSNQTINGVKTFTQTVNIKNNNLDLAITPTNNVFSNITFRDKNNITTASLQNSQRTYGVNDICFYVYDNSSKSHGFRISTDKILEPVEDNTYSLGSASNKWANVYATTFNGNLKGNADTTTRASCLESYSFPDGNKIYLDWDTQVKGCVGLKVDNTVMGGLITTNNIRTYVNSAVVGNTESGNTVGHSVSAYWSNSSIVTATGQSSAGGHYPKCYSEYITKTPVVGTIYSGSQLYTVLNAYASAKASTTGQNREIKVTTVTAQAIFSSPINPAGKYLCTTANTVSFRAYTTSGSSSAVGASSVVNNSSAKSIFTRIE